jgi:hypothetical protein
MLDAYGSAISRIESGGKYDILGPTIPKTGDRAYGKYQIMGANIPQWTEQYLGQRMTPDEFLASPEAQEKVFQGRFGEYVQKYGPEGAAKAWFAGEKGMHNPNAKDVLGTTVEGYGQKFMAGLGGPQGATPVAQMPPQGILAAPAPQNAPTGLLAPGNANVAPAQQPQGILGGGMSPEEVAALMAPPKPLQHLQIPMARRKAGLSFGGYRS